MTLNASGPISLGGATTGQSINLELGVSATALASINATNFRALAGVASGQISLSNFYGKSSTTYYFMRVTISGQSVLSDFLGHGIDGSDNYYWFGNIAGPNYCIKASKTGSSVSAWRWSTSPASPTFYQIGFTPSGRVAMATQGGTTTTNPASTIMGAGFLSAAGSPSFLGGSATPGYFWNDSGGPNQIKSDVYGNQSFSLGGVDSSQNTYHLAKGLSWYQSGTDCCGNPILDLKSTCLVFMKINTSNAVDFIYTIGVIEANTTYNGEITPLIRTDGLIVIGAQQNGTEGFALRLVNVSALTTSWNYKYANTSSGWGSFIYNTPLLTRIDSSNNMYVVVSTTRTTFGQGVLVMKLDSAGNFTWMVGVRRTTSVNFSVSGSVVDSSGNIYVSGYTSGDVGYVFKLNSSGILQWSLQFTTTTITRGINITSDGTIAVFLTNTSNYTGNMVMTLPADGSKTGTFTVGGQSVTVANASFAQDTGLTASRANTTTGTAGFYAGSLSTRNNWYSGSTTTLTPAIATTTI